MGAISNFKTLTFQASQKPQKPQKPKKHQKPKKPKSNFGCMGIYMYSNKVFDALKKIKKSPRGEYEITSVNNYMLRNHECEHGILEDFWMDAGTMESYHYTNGLIYEKE